MNLLDVVVGGTEQAKLPPCVTALRVALIHGAAKFFFGATGRYRSLLQVIWLGWVVQLFNLIPLIGLLIASAWTLIISIWTFEEVDGIERLQALMLVLGVGVFTVAVLALFSLAG
jgi:hypothetical protein